MNKNFVGNFNYNILDKLNIDLNITNNEYDIPLDAIFEMGARKNPKRSFSFVSKLLGKHIAINPCIPIIGGCLLADLFMRKVENKSIYRTELLSKALYNKEFIDMAIDSINFTVPLSKKTLFLGFAEMATGLAHQVFSCFDENAYFLHTTRENIIDLNLAFNFEEEHSHATSHLCYSLQNDYFKSFERIVLVDDEITTGKTCLNLIKALNNKYPNKEYVIVSYLNWRNQENINTYKEFENELNIKIHSLALIEGTINCVVNGTIEDNIPSSVCNNNIEVETIFLPVDKNDKLNLKCKNENNEINEKMYFKLIGRFGLDSDEQVRVQQLAYNYSKLIINKRNYKNLLCVGYGEYIYFPCLISTYLGENVLYQSTTRSPMYAVNKENYPIKNIISFDNPEDKSIKNYLYNIGINQYEEIFMFLERDIPQTSKDYIINEFKKLGIKSLIFIVLE